ncbi:MAG: dienelactone hydrolase family protein [Pseudomonadota bacterium]
MEFDVEVSTADGAMPCFVSHPDANAPFAPIILYMDVPGIREELRDFARRISEQGYLCVLPDLYHRFATDGTPVRFDLRKGEEELKRMFAVGSELSNAMVMRDTRGILDYLDSSPLAKSLTGTIGYCMSGQFVLSAAGTFPERIRASASLYGTRMVTDKEDSPHKLANAVQGEFYLGFAEQDHYVEDFVIPQLQQAFDAHNINYELVIHPDTDHGFCFPQRPTYVEAAAEQVWQSVFAMYARVL